MITRFAPSPTGPLHLGHAFAAWIAWEAARAVDGRFLLRWEDIDPARCRPEYEKAALEDLAWLGFTPDDASMRQSTRMPVYGQALQTLRHRDLLYPCFCTRKDIQRELDNVSQAPQGPDGPLYPGTCRTLDPREAAAWVEEGRPHSWRLKMDHACRQTGPLTWHDRVAGKQKALPETFGDVILARKDTPTSYHLAVTVDDAAQEISLVTRGLDLFPSTHVHRLLQALLDLPVPEWEHHGLIRDAHGRRLAKRDQATALAELRAQGVAAHEIHKRLQAHLAAAAPTQGGMAGSPTEGAESGPNSS